MPEKRVDTKQEDALAQQEALRQVEALRRQEEQRLQAALKQVEVAVAPAVANPEPPREESGRTRVRVPRQEEPVAEKSSRRRSSRRNDSEEVAVSDRPSRRSERTAKAERAEKVNKRDSKKQPREQEEEAPEAAPVVALIVAPTPAPVVAQKVSGSISKDELALLIADEGEAPVMTKFRVNTENEFQDFKVRSVKYFIDGREVPGTTSGFQTQVLSGKHELRVEVNCFLESFGLFSYTEDVGLKVNARRAFFAVPDGKNVLNVSLRERGMTTAYNNRVYVVMEAPPAPGGASDVMN